MPKYSTVSKVLLQLVVVFLDCCRAAGRDFERQGRNSLFTDPLFSLKSPSSARDKNYNSGELKEKSDRATSVFRLGLEKYSVS